MARVKLDVYKLFEYAEAEAMGGFRHVAELIAQDARRILWTNSIKPGVTRKGGFKMANVTFRKTTTYSAKGAARANRYGANVNAGDTRTKIRSASLNRFSGRWPGMLRGTIRVVEKEGRRGNIRVYAGNTNVYWARFVENGTSKMRAKPFMRPALERNRATARRLINSAMEIATKRMNQFEKAA